MHKVTHMVAGVTVGLLVGASPMGLISVAVGSVVPDYDLVLIRRMPRVLGLGREGNGLLKHRGLTHSLVFAAIGFLIYPMLGIGILTHIVLDMLTKAGVQLLWPWKKRVRIPLIAKRLTSNFVMNFAFILICVITLIVRFFPELIG